MSIPVIDYFFTLVSPYAYLGHRPFLELAAAHGATIRYKPVRLSKVFENSGALPLAERPKARQDYRLLELQRWRAKRGVPLNLRPKHFPTNPALADKSVIVLVETGREPGAYIEAAFRACWAEERDLADRDVVAEKLRASGFDPEPVLAAAQGERADRAYQANTVEAVGINAIGSPTYVLNGEVFWGQDRLDLLAEALQSGRAPYSVPA
jgi:2-hydroxychromene-2-carboxylate isomerase